MLVLCSAGKPHIVPFFIFIFLHYAYLIPPDYSPNVAPSLGPVLGGVLAGRLGWPWVFWFLVILSGFCLSTLLIFLPETGRGIVGNGSIPPRGINRSFHSLLCRSNASVASTEIPVSRPIRLPNPLQSLYALSEKDTLLIVLVNGIFYMTYGCIQASLSSLFIDIYGFEELEAGLIYLPFGLGCLIASFISGREFFYTYPIITELA